MVRIEMSVTIDRPVEQVFPYVANAENDPHWRSSTTEAKKLTDGPIGVGTTFRASGKFLGRNIDGESEISAYEPNKKISIKSKSGPFPFEAHMTFEPVNGGTRLSLVGEAEIGGFFKMAEGLVVSAAKKDFESDFGKLKELLEAQRS